MGRPAGRGRDVQRTASRVTWEDAERKCEVCGGPLKASAVLGVCMRNPDCRQEHTRREHAADNLRKRRPHGICEICGGPVRLSSQTGVCVRNPECRRERDRRNYAANPQLKLERDKRHRHGQRPERERKAAERTALREAERARLRERILDLRAQGRSKAAIRRELEVGTPFISEVLQGIPGGACRVCGGPMKSGSISGSANGTPHASARAYSSPRIQGCPLRQRRPAGRSAVRYL